MSMENRFRVGRPDSRSIWQHSGSRETYLERHQRDVDQARSPGGQRMKDLLASLFDRVADDRNLLLAWDHNARVGGPAAGPDGRTYQDYANAEFCGLVRALSQSLKQKTYRPGPERVVRIPKCGRDGTRPLVLQNIQDRLVQRALVQILQPIIDPTFDVNSFGGRPGCGALDALAAAEQMAVHLGRWTWVLADIRDAFTNVPLERLLQVLRKRVPADDVHNLVATVVGNQANLGLRQGGAMSPLLMNLYLDHFLDRPWRRRFPDIPLLRFIDDIALLCEPAEAENAYQALHDMLRPAAMPLKDNATPIVDLSIRQRCDWLGFSISSGAEGLHIGLAAKWRDRLEQDLLETHLKADAHESADLLVRGVVGSWGPVLHTEDPLAIYQEILSVAESAGHEELLDFDEFQTEWLRSHNTWTRKRVRPGPKLAATVMESRFRRARLIRPSGDRPRQLQLFTAASCCREQRTGAWAYILRDVDNDHLWRDKGRRETTTSEELEIIATNKALSMLKGCAEVTIFPSGSEFYLSLINRSTQSGGDGHARGRHRHHSQAWEELDNLLADHNFTIRSPAEHAEHQCQGAVQKIARETMQRSRDPVSSW